MGKVHTYRECEMKNLEGLGRDKVQSRGVGEVKSSQLAQARELPVAKNLRFITCLVNRQIVKDFWSIV